MFTVSRRDNARYRCRIHFLIVLSPRPTARDNVMHVKIARIRKISYKKDGGNNEATIRFFTLKMPKCECEEGEEA